HHLDLRVGRQHQPETGPDRAVVVGQQHRGHVVPSSRIASSTYPPVPNRGNTARNCHSPSRGPASTTPPTDRARSAIDHNPVPPLAPRARSDSVARRRPVGTGLLTSTTTCSSSCPIVSRTGPLPCRCALVSASRTIRCAPC